MMDEQSIPAEVAEAAEEEMVVTSYIQEANTAIEKRRAEVGHVAPQETAQLIANAFNKHSLEKGMGNRQAEVEEVTAGEFYKVTTKLPEEKEGHNVASTSGSSGKTFNTTYDQVGIKLSYC